MALTPGQKLGPYEIVAPLGAGGMGEVYRARDTKLKREVAIKVLPDDVANDHERLARFQREAEVLASLNHPHIAHVYGIEGSALVMELVEGEDLSQRIARGAIPLDEALPIARQIAEALEAAHDAGIIHRDLKPANIKLRSDGTIKVLDFGLAKQGSGIGDQGSAKLANSPTITSPAMTMQGMILGTAAYMAPEQAKGKVVDRRADIWAFGCVLYEMLTGQRTFAGDDVSDTLVSILRDDPCWAALPANTPPHVRLLLRRCLQRDPQKRLPHIGAARLDLADTDTSELTTPVPRSSTRWRLAAVAGAIVGAAVAGVPALLLMRPAPDAVFKFAIDAPPGSALTGPNGVPRFAVSPDGQGIVYQTFENMESRLLIRMLNSVEPIVVPGSATQRGGNSMQQAFWSPDGRSIAFFDEETHQLKHLDRQFGGIRVIANVPGNQYGGAWSDAGVILLASLGTGGIQSVSASGGTVTQLTRVDAALHEGSHLWPHFFEDGRHFVYLTAYTDGTPSALFLASLDGGPARRLISSPSSALPAPRNYLLFARDGTTVAQKVDLVNGTLLGEPVAIAQAVARTPQGRSALSLSRTGVLTYSEGGDNFDRFETRWVDRAGRALASSPKPVPARVRALRLSSDGSQLAYVRSAEVVTRDSNLEIWIQDTVRGIDTKVGHPPIGAGLSVVFSPDGTELITRQFGNPGHTLQRQPLFGSGPPREILKASAGELTIPYEWTSDGQVIVSRSAGGGMPGLWTIPVDGRREATLYLQAEVRFGASLSPDGRWFAYTSGTEVGKGQVFLQTFPDASGGKWPVSAVGGSHPRWSRDGRELFFIAGGQLMAVSIATSPALQIGQPRPLFPVSDVGLSYDMPGASSPYEVMKGGGFVVLAAKQTAIRPTLVVITDWMRAAGIKH